MEYVSEVHNSVAQNPFLFFSYERQKRSRRQQHLVLSNEGRPKVESINSRRGGNKHEKFFPKDFFNNLSKHEKLSKHRGVIHSAVRKI